MKSILKSMVFIVVAYLLLTFLNMGLVMLFFYENPDSGMLLPLITQAIVIISIGTFIQLKLRNWFKLSQSKIPINVLLLMIGIVSCLNLYLDVSLEPSWFVTMNFIFVLIGFNLVKINHKNLIKEG